MKRSRFLQFWRAVLLIPAWVPQVFGQMDVQNAAPIETTPPQSESALSTALRLIEAYDESIANERPVPDTTELEKAVERARTEAASDPRFHYVVGRWYAISGRRGDAVTSLRKYVDSREGRNDWRAHLALGDLFVDQFPHLAQSSYDQANSLKADEPDVLFGLSRCAEKLGRMPDALTYAQRLVDISPTARHRAMFARLLFTQKRYDDAEREAEGALNSAIEAQEKDPTRVALALQIDGYYRLLLDMRQARLKENPAEVGNYIAVARLIRERAQLGQRIAMMEAVEVLQSGIANFKADAPLELRMALAIALAESGRTAEAQEEFNAILKSNPDHAIAAEWLNRLSKPSTSTP